MKAFICHNSQDSAFAIELASHLKPSLDVFYFEEHQRADASFLQSINEALADREVMVIVLGLKFSPYQVEETNTAHRLHIEGKPRSFFLVRLPGKAGETIEIPPTIIMLGGFPILKCDGRTPEDAKMTAASIVRNLGITWRSADDLPLNPHLFSYEKDIIRFFIKRIQYADECFAEARAPDDEEVDFNEMRNNMLDGSPSVWPTLKQWQFDQDYGGLFNRQTAQNRLDPAFVGDWRDLNPHFINAAAAASGTEKLFTELSFSEAGPRSELFFPIRDQSLKVAVMVSGGIAPGINAVIDGIVQRHWMYASGHNYENSLTILGLQNGFRAFDNLDNSHRLLAASREHYSGKDRRLETSSHAHEGGSILGTSRVDDLMDDNCRLRKLAGIDMQLKDWNVDILYVIGGDGSMKAAHALWSVASENQDRKTSLRPLSIVAIPKTMDNDILWVWQSFGFLSAVEKARQVVEDLWTEVTSNPRLCIVQLFGSDSGFVVSHSLLASSTGHCNVALIPEIEFSMRGIAKHLKQQMCKHLHRIPYGLVVMAETAIPTDALNYIGIAKGVAPQIDIGLSDDEQDAIRQYDKMKRDNRRIMGQTNDALRTAGLKIVSRGLPKLLVDPAFMPLVHNRVGWKYLRVFTNEPRHLLRAIAPSCSDIIMGHRLGTLAVDNGMAGYTDFMVSQWLTEYVMIPLKLVVLGRKRIPTSGIFWKSVLAKTGQPPDLNV